MPCFRKHGFAPRIQVSAEEPLSLRRPLHPQDPALPTRKDAVHTYARLIATFKLRGTFLCKTKPSSYTLVLCRRTWALRSPRPDEIPEAQPLPWTSCLEEAKQCYVASSEHIIRDGARGRGHADFGRNRSFLEGSAITMCWEQLPHGTLGKGTSSWRCTPALDLSWGSGDGWISNCSIPASTPCVEPEGHSLGQLPTSEQGRVEGEPGRWCHSAGTESHGSPGPGELLLTHPEGWAGELALGFPCPGVEDALALPWLGDRWPCTRRRAWDTWKGTCPWPGPGKHADVFCFPFVPHWRVLDAHQ